MHRPPQLELDSNLVGIETDNKSNTITSNKNIWRKDKNNKETDSRARYVALGFELPGSG